jgi:hypothetical protein
MRGKCEQKEWKRSLVAESWSKGGVCSDGRNGGGEQFRNRCQEPCLGM